MKIYKIVRAEYHSVHVDYLFLRERRREVSKKIEKFAKPRLGDFYGAVGFVILAVIWIIVAQRHPNEIYCFPCNVFLVRIDLGPI
jgi:hypothetical protein